MNIVINSEGKEIVMKLITDNSDVPGAPEELYRLKVDAPEGFTVATFTDVDDQSYIVLGFEPK